MKLRHIATKCGDLEEAKRFYEGVFEFKEVGRASEPSADACAIYMSDGSINIALINIGDPNYPNYRPDGLNHIGFVVDDVAAAVERAQQFGATLHRDTDDEGSGVTWETKMRTPDGLVAFDFTTHGWPIGG
jgi:catechol 2,3-dioxygenase-like lactoylglutathione lyase family enzyme